MVYSSQVCLERLERSKSRLLELRQLRNSVERNLSDLDKLEMSERQKLFALRNRYFGEITDAERDYKAREEVYFDCLADQ